MYVETQAKVRKNSKINQSRVFSRHFPEQNVKLNFFVRNIPNFG